MIALIPAKSFSERIKNKNTRLLNGKSLLQRTIDTALESKVFSQVWVSSESQDLLNTLPNTARTHLRPVELSESTSTVFSVCQELILAQGITENFAVLLCSSPLRTANDIQEAVKLLKDTQCVMSVTELSHPPEHSLKICERNRLHPVSWATIDHKRQTLTPKYRHDGSIIICNTESFLAVDDFYDLDTIPFMTPKERSLDVNTMYDWRLAEYLLRGK